MYLRHGNDSNSIANTPETTKPVTLNHLPYNVQPLLAVLGVEGTGVLGVGVVGWGYYG